MLENYYSIFIGSRLYEYSVFLTGSANSRKMYAKYVNKKNL